MTTSIFKSFLMGGFESSSHRNSQDVRIDMIAASEHDRQAAGDYALVKEQGLLTIRDGTRWHLIEASPGVYDFSSLEPMVDAALASGLQVIWGLMHYGVPDWLDIFSDEFPVRFADYSRTVAEFILAKHKAAGREDIRVYVPVNEISYMAWAGSRAMAMYPRSPERGDDLKYQLVRAVIKSMDAVREVDPDARFIHVDPIIHVMEPRGQDHLKESAAAWHDLQYETWDMIAGRVMPELGGDPRYLDIIGMNFYHDNQWEHPNDEILHWSARPRDDRWKRFSDLARPFMSVTDVLSC